MVHFHQKPTALHRIEKVQVGRVVSFPFAFVCLSHLSVSLN